MTNASPTAPQVRERRFEWTDPRALARDSRTVPGLDFLSGMIDGKTASPPAAGLLGFRITQASEGRAVFEYVPHESHYNPIGTVHGGVVAAVFDAALGCAVHTTLPAGVGYTTLELHTNFVRAVGDGVGVLTCEAAVVHAGRTVATAQATLKDAAGKLYAHATTTCLVLRP